MKFLPSLFLNEQESKKILFYLQLRLLRMTVAQKIFNVIYARKVLVSREIWEGIKRSTVQVNFTVNTAEDASNRKMIWITTLRKNIETCLPRLFRCLYWETRIPIMILTWAIIWAWAIYLVELGTSNVAILGKALKVI